MAKRMVTTLVDDLDGSELGVGEGVTLRFGLDGRTYEVDLSDENAEQFRGKLTAYVAAARKVTPARSRRRR